MKLKNLLRLKETLFLDISKLKVRHYNKDRKSTIISFFGFHSVFEFYIRTPIKFKLRTAEPIRK